jgi:hypothetical protein
MSELSTLFLLLALVAVAGAWLKLSAAREHAVRVARRQCEQYGLQLLDETVGLRGMRLRRIRGRWVIERGYGLEVSIDGDDRESGRLWMIGHAMSGLSLPTIELATPGDTTVPTSPVAAVPGSNVIPLRPRDNSGNRLH